jgi:hypothetical protein
MRGHRKIAKEERSQGEEFAIHDGHRFYLYGGIRNAFFCFSLMSQGTLASVKPDAA